MLSVSTHIESGENMSAETPELDSQFDNLFLKVNPIFSNEHKLTKFYVPQNIVARNKEITDLANNLEPIMRHNPPFNVYIWGDRGIGKTITVEHVVKILSNGLKAKNINTKVDYIRINCHDENTTDLTICNQILSFFNVDIQTKGFPISYYMRKIWETINEIADTYSYYSLIIFFDEINYWDIYKNRSDKTRTNLLYSFTRAYENKHINPSNCSIGIIAASNENNYLTKIDPSILSSAGFNYMQFPPYNADDLYKIMMDRLDAFQPCVIEFEYIKCLAEKVSNNYYGDARRALDILNKAGNIALQKGKTRITKDDLKDADIAIAIQASTDNIKNINKHDQYLILSIFINSKLGLETNTGLVIKMYEKVCKQIFNIKKRSQDHNSHRLTFLEDQQLINSQKGNKGNTRIFTIPSNIETSISSIFAPELLVILGKHKFDYLELNNNLRTLTDY